MPTNKMSAAAAAVAVTTLLGLLALADVARCLVGLTQIGSPPTTSLMFVGGLLGAALSALTAAAVLRRQRWSRWSAAQIGLMSAPQAAMSGFRVPYAIPDLGTAVLGIALTASLLVAVQAPPRNATLATCRTRSPGSASGVR